jgi:hypothetical protein
MCIVFSGCCGTGFYLVDKSGDCPGGAAIYANDCTRGLGGDKACCSRSQLILEAPTDGCCDKGFNLISSEECSGSQAIYVDECTKRYPGKVCCSESSIDENARVGGNGAGADCCDEGFELVGSDSECPGDKAIALSECASALGKVCCSV